VIDLGLRRLAAVRLRSEGNLVGPAQERDRAVDMPISAAVAALLSGKVTVDAAIEGLLARPFKAEE